MIDAYLSDRIWENGKMNISPHLKISFSGSSETNYGSLFEEYGTQSNSFCFKTRVITTSSNLFHVRDFVLVYIPLI